jgi:ATP-dependent DNA helicase DinG
MVKDKEVEKNGARVYCSLDIETSGFDPLKNEVLEIGFVFFEAAKAGFKITDEYTRVFKPNGKVEANILGLTGISQDELDSAEPFSEHKSDLQKKLRDAVIVGHNIAFDIKFLESTGLKFSGNVIDTLDLVQWILPTHHSYNLENLMHTFGISHKEAHRALADSKATLKLLEKLLQVYSGFPNQTKPVPLGRIFRD